MRLSLSRRVHELTRRSSNGTFVNYEKMGKGEQKLLKHGDRIDLVRPSRCADTGPCHSCLIDRLSPLAAPVAYIFEDFIALKRSLKEHEACLLTPLFSALTLSQKAVAGRYSLGRELGAYVILVSPSCMHHAHTLAHAASTRALARTLLTLSCSGNFSRVYLAYRNDDRREVAVKCIDKRRFWSSPKTKEQLLREAEILREVSHPNVISVYEVVDSEQFLYLVLELYVHILRNFLHGETSKTIAPLTAATGRRAASCST